MTTTCYRQKGISTGMFEHLTCVPIQTKMVKENMLSKEEKQWLKVRTSDASNSVLGG
jgi:hypothetical protein